MVVLWIIHIFALGSTILHLNFNNRLIYLLRCFIDMDI